jgi:hypothetical protein
MSTLTGDGIVLAVHDQVLTHRVLFLKTFFGHFSGDHQDVGLGQLESMVPPGIESSPIISHIKDVETPRWDDAPRRGFPDCCF